jgi:ALG6, ALG8 glycosyltransferase family
VVLGCPRTQSAFAAQAAAAAAVASGREVLGSVLFCLALNHKQMTMYYAPAFFANLLGRCLQRRTAAAKVTGSDGGAHLTCPPPVYPCTTCALACGDMWPDTM